MKNLSLHLKPEISLNIAMHKNKYKILIQWC